MDKQSTLYQLMGIRMNGVMNGITQRDEDYQTLLRAVDEYSDKLEALHLSAEAMKLVDRYMSGYNAIRSRYGMLAYLPGFFDCRDTPLADLDYQNMFRCLPEDQQKEILGRRECSFSWSAGVWLWPPTSLRLHSA